MAIACVATIAVASNKDKNKDAEGKPEILFTKSNHDFGFIREEKGPVTCVFEFENVGTAPLIIVSASAQCGCTRPEYPQKPIKPGKKGKIKVTFSPIGRPGPFRKEIRVKTNARNKVVRLHIEGSVIGKDSQK